MAFCLASRTDFSSFVVIAFPSQKLVRICHVTTVNSCHFEAIRNNTFYWFSAVFPDFWQFSANGYTYPILTLAA
jgi:hypothetical protein